MCALTRQSTPIWKPIEAAVAGGAFDDIITLERLEAWLALGRNTLRVRVNEDVTGRLGVAYAVGAIQRQTRRLLPDPADNRGVGLRALSWWLLGIAFRQLAEFEAAADCFGEAAVAYNLVRDRLGRGLLRH